MLDDAFGFLKAQYVIFVGIVVKVDLLHLLRSGLEHPQAQNDTFQQSGP